MTKKGSYHRVSKLFQPKKKRKTMFQKAKSAKYSKMIKIDSIPHALESVQNLIMEFTIARTRDKRIRLIRYATLAANRSIALAKKKNISPIEKKELTAIAKIYRDFVKKYGKLIDSDLR